jgi:hypothetical protein
MYYQKYVEKQKTKLQQISNDGYKTCGTCRKTFSPNEYNSVIIPLRRNRHGGGFYRPQKGKWCPQCYGRLKTWSKNSRSTRLREKYGLIRRID